MNILVLDEEFPYPLNTGKRIRSYHLHSRLARRHTVHYLAYGRPDSAAYRYLEKAGLHPHAVPHNVQEKSGPLFYYRLAANLWCRRPYIVTSHHSRAFASAVTEAVTSISPELVICEWTPYAVFLPYIEHTKVLIAAHNIEADIWRRYEEHEKSMFKRWYIRQQAKKVARFEQFVFLAVDAITAVTAADAAKIADVAPGTTTAVIENGVDLDYFYPAGTDAHAQRLVFTGSMDWRPNQDAAEFFIQDIYPLLQKTYPNTEVCFVGRNPPGFIRDFNKIKGVTVTGTVDDVRPYVRDAAVYIVPLRIGGGSRLKILEALAMGQAVVSTTVGAEGLAVCDGREILLADSPVAFARQTARLLDDAEFRRQLGRAGRSFVEQKHGWDALAGKLADFLESIAAS